MTESRKVWFTCCVCGNEFYRYKAQVANGAGKTCSLKCKSTWTTGENAPFWGRTHTEAVRKARSAPRPYMKGNKHAGGYHHTEEAKKRISEASKRLWAEHREKMVASLPRGLTHHYAKAPELRRYRQNFTSVQRREWIDTTCAYCDTTEHLELDHIIPIFDGGHRHRANVQTLCRGCNLWKTHFVDRPRYAARLACQGTLD